jgi:integrase
MVLSEHFRREAAGRPEDTDGVIADHRPLDLRAFAAALHRVLRQVGLPLLRLHDACHSFATMLLELGESPKTVQTMLGHSSVSITLDIYSHVSLELETRAATRLNAALTGGA